MHFDNWSKMLSMCPSLAGGGGGGAVSASCVRIRTDTQLTGVRSDTNSDSDTQGASVGLSDFMAMTIGVCSKLRTC